MDEETRRRLVNEEAIRMEAHARLSAFWRDEIIEVIGEVIDEMNVLEQYELWPGRISMSFGKVHDVFTEALSAMRERRQPICSAWNNLRMSRQTVQKWCPNR